MQTESQGPELEASSKAARLKALVVGKQNGKTRGLFLSTPSEDLIYALGNFGQTYARPKQYFKKADLSFVGPRSLAMDRIQAVQKGKEILRGRRLAAARRAEGVKTQRSFQNRLPSFLAKYIELVNTVVDVDFTQCSVGKVKRVTGSWCYPGEARFLVSNDVYSGVSFLTAFNERKLEWLRRRGYDIIDLATWEWLFTAKTSEQAAIRLTKVANQSDPKLGAVKRIPTFVLLFLLRRRDFSPRSLRLLLEYVWDRLIYQGVAGFSSSPMHSEPAAAKRFLYPELSEPTIMVMIIRLLRQARKVWPAAIVNISIMMTKFINGTGIYNGSPSGLPLSEQTSARMTFLYNRMLSLLAHPSPLGPFRSLLHRQRAQFIVLKRMDEFRPSLAVTREGYRAVTAVQLAHKKTPRERKWATMKALSWPPWKEEKLGIDTDIGLESGRSRATESLWRAREAGYPLRAWEDAAGILAGWDTDRTPTIQTKAILRPRNFFREVLNPGGASASQVEHGRVIWAARVRATRTIDESWACFLAYKSLDQKTSEVVYYAMFEKIIYEATRVKQQSRVDSGISIHNPHVNSLPGDCKETFPVPGPQQALYVRTPAPSVYALFKLMRQDQIRPSGRLLAFLWNQADDFDMAIEYLRESSLKSSTMKALLGQGIIQPESTRAELEPMEDYLFAAFIKLLCRFAPSTNARSFGSDDNPETIPLRTVLDPEAKLEPPTRLRINPLLQAFQLMEIRKPHYRPPWNSLLAALTRPGTSVSRVQTRNSNVQTLLTWNAMCSLLQHMQETGLETDFHGFNLLCLGLQRARFASQRILGTTELPVCHAIRIDSADSWIKDAEWSTHIKLEAEQILSAGVEHVKKHFKRLVEVKISSRSLTPQASKPFQHPDLANTNIELPRLLEIPDPSQLHVFIRLLGFCEDYVGLLDLVQWMSYFAPELQAVASEPGNGMKLFRRCVVAIRVFLERSWLSINCQEEDRDGGLQEHEAGEGASQEIFHQIFAIVDKNEAWGAWPTDEEVAVYCRQGRFYVASDQAAGQSHL